MRFLCERLGLLNVFCLERLRIDIETSSRVQAIYHYQSDQQRQRRNNLEIDQRLDSDSAKFFYVRHRRDTVNDRTEDDRCDYHLHEVDKTVSERFQEEDGGIRAQAQQNAPASLRGR